jgi:hypothetical protein
MTTMSLRFDDQGLQARFVSELARLGVPHVLAESGAVECPDTDWNQVNSVAHEIRDSCFRWYFSWFDSETDAQHFWAALRRSDLPFQVEHHKDRTVFLLAREHESDYGALMSEW